MLRLLLVIISVFFSTNLIAEKNQKEATQNFKSFTGKITASKVRLRSGPDLDGHIISQLNKNELVLVVKDAKDFWAVKPIANIKAYVFRNYIIDNIVEANKVNVRLAPNLDSPIIGQLKQKDAVQGIICSQNNKWLEITPPDDVCFYIAKEYVTYAGNNNYFAQMKNRKSNVEELLNTAYFITQSECKKPYDEMVPNEAIHQFDTIIQEYSDFPQHVQQAKEGLALLQDNYLQKKIAYLESKANISHMERNELLTAVENVSTFDEPKVLPQASSPKNLTDKMTFWKTLEHSLYATWTTFHPEKKLNDFYKEQEINAITVAGILESYSQSIKNKPGDFIVKQEGSEKAYLYSTQVNLDEYVGKKVKLTVSPRPNNNFAFPAYFVNSVEVQ
ncbi:MAG: hypothetical protein K940chlam1_01121 [Candidatus Anoxychlamydiales bacterium]|nr:hypothetical protein [Candidatus Anoxychlamydiales bacterium]NGX35435.1 hypothetical protein [Candidatus Anoxychlamydiales bacterium]